MSNRTDVADKLPAGHAEIMVNRRLLADALKSGKYRQIGGRIGAWADNCSIHMCFVGLAYRLFSKHAADAPKGKMAEVWCPPDDMAVHSMIGFKESEHGSEGLRSLVYDNDAGVSFHVLAGRLLAMPIEV